MMKPIVGWIALGSLTLTVLAHAGERKECYRVTKNTEENGAYFLSTDLVLCMTPNHSEWDKVDLKIEEMELKNGRLVPKNNGTTKLDGKGYTLNINKEDGKFRNSYSNPTSKDDKTADKLAFNPNGHNREVKKAKEMCKVAEEKLHRAYTDEEKNCGFFIVKKGALARVYYYRKDSSELPDLGGAESSTNVKPKAKSKKSGRKK